MTVPALSPLQSSIKQALLGRPDPHAPVLRVPLLDTILPGGGLPRGAVTELTCTPPLAKATSLALSVCASAQRETLLRGGEPAWCAWLDTQKTLHAPGVAAHDVVLERLLVVSPPAHAFARIAVRLVDSRVFSAVIVDTLGVPGDLRHEVPLHRWHNVVRRLALSARAGDTSVVLLTQRQSAWPVGLPVAMRVQLDQPDAGRLRVTVTKERWGRVGMTHELPYVRSLHPNVLRSA